MVGISNSLGFYSNILEYYAKFLQHRTEQLIFEPYAASEIEKIIRGKLGDKFPTQDPERFFSKDALHHIGSKVESRSGDLRVAFDICKTALQDHIARSCTEPVSLLEVESIFNARHQSKLSSIVQGLPRESQILVAALYTKLEGQQKTVFT